LKGIGSFLNGRTCPAFPSFLSAGYRAGGTKMADQFPPGFKLADYEYLKDLPTEGWAWEFMRRNKEDRKILESKDHPGHPLLKWGIVSNPDLTYPELLAKINEDFKRVKGVGKENEEKEWIDNIFSVPSVNDTFSLTRCEGGLQCDEYGPFDYVFKFDIRSPFDEIRKKFSELLKREHSWIKAAKRGEVPKEMIPVWKDAGTHKSAYQTTNTWIEGLLAYDLHTRYKMDKTEAYKELSRRSTYWKDGAATYADLQKAGNHRYNTVAKMIEKCLYKTLPRGMLGGRAIITLSPPKI